MLFRSRGHRGVVEKEERKGKRKGESQRDRKRERNGESQRERKRERPIARSKTVFSLKEGGVS